MVKKKLALMEAYPPPPLPGEVLYVPPAPNGAGRMCSNCALYLSTHRGDGDARCMVHEPSLPIAPQQVCGYHVFGQPRHHTGLDVEEFVTPELSGLITAPRGGTRCGNCYFYEGVKRDLETAACLAVAGKESDLYGSGANEIEPPGAWTPAEVNKNGCCSRWRETD